ncbi:acyl-CoA dehydrogenase family protein [Sphingobium sufflavum]|uniref:acyl-CoA dehydrogenase family protein n=1 Tax=Sphingobium sufflavum TaxID=1129547 RepID=UPI001F450ACD|nr:acyl-CoA dehydrogenase family protein [Sphingobium sufflavum]MCE7796143.1 acyl-CoA dehydrogenase family protein [Sphingobium sufflavum]
MTQHQSVATHIDAGKVERPDQAATQIAQGWGQGPSARYEELAAPFRPIFRRIREDAVVRDAERRLPFEEVGWLKQAGFTTLRVPVELGGYGVTLPELLNLLIELSEADPNITNILRPHLGVTEDLLNSGNAAHRTHWLTRIAARETFGNGFSETTGNVGAISTSLVQDGDEWVLNGKKYYTTGTLFADWINLGAVDEKGESTGGIIPRHAPGVEVIDDWNGFGQMLTGSGTTLFDNVRIPAALVNPEKGRARYVGGLFQLIHLATLAGIGRAAANDVARLVAERSRAYGHGNAAEARHDPQILAVVGRVRGAAYAAGATVLKVAEALERVHEHNRSGDKAAEELAGALADVEINETVTVISELILNATTALFDALGASGTDRNHGLDRHWRNARTITSHNPRIYRDRIVGAFAVNGALPALVRRNVKDDGAAPGGSDNSASPPIL